jgi:hypothetical protein
MIEGLVAFFQSLNRLLALFERIGKWTKEHNLDAWISDLEASIDKLEKAESPEQKLDAARSIVGAVRSIK